MKHIGALHGWTKHPDISVSEQLGELDMSMCAYCTSITMVISSKPERSLQVLRSTDTTNAPLHKATGMLNITLFDSPQICQYSPVDLDTPESLYECMLTKHFHSCGYNTFISVHSRQVSDTSF